MLKVQALEAALDITLQHRHEHCYQKPIFKGLNLEVAHGEFVMIIGSNGAGKSTLFNLIAGHTLPKSGTIILDGQDITTTPPATRSAAIAQVMQDPQSGTVAQMSIVENMALAYQRGAQRMLRPYSTSRRKALFRAQLATLEMGLEHRLDQPVAQLSGGQRQALSLIMALSSAAKVMLLDEITAALDPKSADNVMRIAAKVVQQAQCTTLMITHNMAHALHYGDRILVLGNGQVLKQFNHADKKLMTPADLAASLDH